MKTFQYYISCDNVIKHLRTPHNFTIRLWHPLFRANIRSSRYDPHAILWLPITKSDLLHLQVHAMIRSRSCNPFEKNLCIEVDPEHGKATEFPRLKLGTRQPENEKCLIVHH
ncbi:hypothetical protein KC19_VG270900 [Ceratodon purpureus]|uniref:Uncharacterized protein n=1 Tax=Ceratodon purpureus TaxID=3225 RepID=A0A8T0HVL4_CERPU|nr:hypothetical protein KC19_VG270900 [Ceratodon purpureus]